jgi:HPt (histidine-containing phosphotransfer) domain-containing protein
LPAHFAALRSALGEGDLAAVAEIGHAIRSAAGAAGFAALHAAAHDLERAARSGDGAAARRQLAACEALYPPALAAARSAVAASA